MNLTVPSGSGRVNQNEKWKFYGQMEFLRDTCLVRPTSSNINRAVEGEHDENECDQSIDLSEIVEEQVNEESSQTFDVQPNKKPKRRSTKDDDTIIILNRIADAIAKEEPPPVLPPAPQIDDVDGFLIGIGTHLRRLPQQEKMETIIEILNLVHQKCRRFAVDN